MDRQNAPSRIEAAPSRAAALCRQGIEALKRGDIEHAHEQLCAARQCAPNDPMVLMALVSVYRKRGERDAEREAIEAALSIDPYLLPGLLARASWYERFGSADAAAITYANALRISPPQPHWPEAFRPQLAHGRDLVMRRSAMLHDHLGRRLAVLQEKLPGSLCGRWTEAAAMLAGRSEPFCSRSNQLHVPRLPAIPFFERSAFPRLEMLEAQTDVIREELLTLLASGRHRFDPYVGYPPGAPVNQWAELNHSARWSAFHLWRNGAPVEENLDRCRATARALASLGMADIGGLCPNAMFSVLAPKTRIPPHHGETNARVVGHLPLVVPDGCVFRVGFEERAWEAGKVLVFDDTIEHEARNDSEELRVVLIFDMWNPLLEPAEREMARAMAAAAREFALPARTGE